MGSPDCTPASTIHTISFVGVLVVGSPYCTPVSAVHTISFIGVLDVGSPYCTPASRVHTISSFGVLGVGSPYCTPASSVWVPRRESEHFLHVTSLHYSLSLVTGDRPEHYMSASFV